MKRLLGYVSGTRGPWHEEHDASSAEGGIRGTGRSHREDSEQGTSNHFHQETGQGAQSPAPAAGSGSHRQGNRKSRLPPPPHPPPVLFQTVRAERVPFEARRDPINQDSNQQRKAVSLPCQVSGGSLKEDSGQHLAQKRGSGLDKCPAPTREACGVTPPHFLCGELHGGPLCTCVWGGVGEGVRQNKSLGPASGHENAPERTRT